MAHTAIAVDTPLPGNPTTHTGLGHTGRRHVTQGKRDRGFACDRNKDKGMDQATAAWSATILIDKGGSAASHDALGLCILKEWGEAKAVHAAAEGSHVRMHGHTLKPGQAEALTGKGRQVKHMGCLQHIHTRQAGHARTHGGRTPEHRDTGGYIKG